MSTVENDNTTVQYAPLIDLLSRKGDDKLATTRKVRAFQAVFMDVEVARLSELIVSRKEFGGK